MYARASGPRDLWRHPPGKITPLARAKESSPVKIDFQRWRTPPDVEAPASPSRRRHLQQHGASVARRTTVAQLRRIAKRDLRSRNRRSNTNRLAHVRTKHQLPRPLLVATVRRPAPLAYSSTTGAKRHLPAASPAHGTRTSLPFEAELSSNSCAWRSSGQTRNHASLSCPREHQCGSRPARGSPPARRQTRVAYRRSCESDASALVDAPSRRHGVADQMPVRQRRQVCVGRREPAPSVAAPRLERQSGGAVEAAALVLATQEFAANGGGRR
jgi:hypothetical protein